MTLRNELNSWNESSMPKIIRTISMNNTQHINIISKLKLNLAIAFRKK